VGGKIPGIRQPGRLLTDAEIAENHVKQVFDMTAPVMRPRLRGKHRAEKRKRIPPPAVGGWRRRAAESAEGSSCPKVEGGRDNAEPREIAETLAGKEAECASALPPYACVII
jgi:hypothetical protein